MSTIDLNHVVSMNNVSVMNSNFDIIEAAINGDVVHVKGGQNVMQQDLDMNGHSLLNVTTGSTPGSLLTVGGGDARYYKQHQVPNPSLPGDAVNKATLDMYNLPQGFFQQVGTGAVQRSWNGKVGETFSVTDFGVVPNAASDQSTTIQAAINAVPVNGVLEFPPGIYRAKNLLVPRAMTLKGVSYGKWGPVVGLAPAAPVGATLLLSANAPFLIKVGDVTSGAPVEGFSAENMVFTGNNNVPSDALVILEQTQSPYFDGCNFAYTTGKVLRMRWVFEPLFNHCMFRSNDSSAVVGMIHIDSIYNGNALQNVNNLRFLGSCHFENNLGTYIYAETNSALDILEIADNKFEWGRSGVPSNGPWPLFDIRSCFRLNITNNTFTNYKAANKYDCILQVGDDIAPSNVSGSMEGNFFQNGDASTFIARIRGSSSMRIKNNQESNAQIQGLYTVTSKNAQDLEFWDSVSNALGQNRARVGDNIGMGFISAHKVSFNNNVFVADANSLSIPGTVASSATTSTVLIDVAPKKYTGSPVAIRFGVRARSASGTGTIDVISAGNATQTITLTSSYQTYFIDVQPSAITSTPGQLYRVNVGSASPEAVFVDGVYVNPIGLSGTTTNNNAPAGNIGEYTFGSATAVAATTGVPVNVTSISLTPGDWDVTGIVQTQPAGTTTTGSLIAGISTASATFQTAAAGVNNTSQIAGIAVSAGSVLINAAPTTRISIATTTTVFLVAQVGFAVSTMTLSGFIRARRVR